MENGINNISPIIRDILLNKNLLLSDTVTNNGLSTLAVGLGTQVNIEGLNSSVLASEDIELSSERYRNAIIKKNKYFSTDDMVKATIVNNDYNYYQINGGYINEKNQLNLGGTSTQPYDTIASILSQEGFNLSSGGISPQSDIRTTLAGKVLGKNGYNETPLGIIAGEQLLLAFEQRAFFNFQKETLGKVNLQPFSLLKGNDFINPDYTITVRETTGGKILDKGLDLIGLELPLPVISEDASIFNNNFNSTTVDRNNALLKNTGRGQTLRLFELLNHNSSEIIRTKDGDIPTFRYKPDYQRDTKGKEGVNDPKEYPDNKTSQLNDFSTYVTELDNEELGNIWEMDSLTVSDDDNSLLAKTKRLFSDEVKRRSLFHLQGTPSIDKSQLNTPSGGRLSKGSGVLSEEFLLGGGESDNTFCRTWSFTKQYKKVSDLQKNSGLYNYKNKIRNNYESSVLGDNGFVKISPYKLSSTESDKRDAKKFMFSIENLAWNDNIGDLPQSEVGNGDLLSGIKGRIMWFPPYDIKFSDTTAVNWDSSQFIGRGEPIYTYNNTERSGNLSFKIIIDYPDYMNDTSIKSDDVFASIAAGCSDYENLLSVNEQTKFDSKVSNPDLLLNQIQVVNEITPDNIEIYFPNDVATISSTYEISGNPTGTTIGEGYTSELGEVFDNRSNNGFNDKWGLNEASFISTLREDIANCPSCLIRIKGYASKAGTTTSNKNLGIARAESVKQWLISNLGSDIEQIILPLINIADTQSSSLGVVDSKNVKLDRKAIVVFEYTPENDSQVTNVTETEKEIDDRVKQEIKSEILRRFHREDEYFEKLANSDAQSDKIIYNSIREKIKFFQPAFHSTTPEGFNSRLTFLQQCTRQGPTNSGVKTNNLAFGRPPVCILRIGDFYHTKIIINTLDIQYEPLVWDLNPEGVGVQPMIANITIGFKFIGGSSLNGPINRLQNAVSFNYFGNTEVYDPRSDKFIADSKKGIDEKFTLVDGESNLSNIGSDENSQNNESGEKTKSVGTNQEKAAEIELKKVEELPPDDTDILENLGWVITTQNNSFVLAYNGDVSYPLAGLEESYNIKLQVKELNKDNFIDVLTGNLFSISESGYFYAKVNAWSKYMSDTNDFKLIISGGNINNVISYKTF